MKPFVPGQRWISEMEPELGLGTLDRVGERRISVVFVQGGCTRQYTLEDAPLKRIRFSPGDRVSVNGRGAMVVDRVEDRNGLMFYHGSLGRVPESDLSDTAVLTTPRDRFLAGVIHDPGLFDLRYRLLQARCRHRASRAFGFIGGRVTLIPHQFYIAGQVTSRYRPRVLLADETGLGKTIEACLILHRLLLAERIQRVLVLVPESLVHQWFVELYRRFNLAFRIPETSRSGNPFLDDSLFICGMDTLSGDRAMQDQVRGAGWDMVVVDEAHHLVAGSPVHGIVADLAPRTHGLLFLSATPEQLGSETQFVLLRLLDPERYPDLDTVLEQAGKYGGAAREVQALVKDPSWVSQEAIRLHVEDLLDRHGPGRVIFRNTRRVITGFASRRVILYRLEAGQDHRDRVNREWFQSREGVRAGFSYRDDPRIDCVVRVLTDNPGEKMLLICSSSAMASEVERAVKTRLNMDIAPFNETMTLIQRDRSAAWFSEPSGARLMVCSEIGSEGRNFQFASHLILFDLPADPELLEQRIGRLDRIGQARTIVIHVPYVAGSVAEIIALWYHEGVGLFETMVSGVHAIGVRFRDEVFALAESLRASGDLPEREKAGLLARTRQYRSDLAAFLEQGRDLLLELNSFRPGPARELTDAVTAEDRDQTIDDVMLAVFDLYGIPVDTMGKRTYWLTLDGIDCRDFPVPAHRSGGMPVTFDREKALAREDMEFLTWDHPMVESAVELILGSGTGNASMADMPGLAGPEILLEMVFLLECIAPASSHIGRFLPPTPIRVVLNPGGEDVGEAYRHPVLEKGLVTADRLWVRQCPDRIRTWLPEMIRRGLVLAEVEAAGHIRSGTGRVQEILGREIQRLIRLKTLNPSIREEEIDAVSHERDVLVSSIASSRLRLDSLRLIRNV